MRFVSLFAGIGGFDLALERQGHTCVYANDFDKYCKITYDKHFNLPLDIRSIRSVDANDIPDHDLLVGGFPCQSFSIAGLRGGFSDTRGTLFFEIARILKSKRPPYLLLENVKGLLSHDNGRTFQTILWTLNELGYECQWQILNSKNFGVPQNRERVFIVGHLRGTSRPEIFPIRKSSTVSDQTFRGEQESRQGVRSEISSTIDTRYGALRNSGETYLQYVGAVMLDKNKKWLEDGKTLSRNFPQGQRVYSSEGISATLASQAGGLGAKTGLYTVPPQPYIQSVPHGYNPGWKKEFPNLRAHPGTIHNEPVVIPVLTPDRANKRQNGRRFKEDGDPSFTLTTQDKHGVFDGEKIRRLTPTECERLQGFPDGWTAYGQVTQQYDIIGNIWEHVRLNNVSGELSSGNLPIVSCITRDGRDGEMQISFLPKSGQIKENVQLRIVSEMHTVENGVCDTINPGKDMVMFCSQNETYNIETITKLNHIREKMDEKSTYPLWSLCLEENLSKEKLFTILTWTKKTMEQKIFSSLQTGKPITNVIIRFKKLEQNYTNEVSLVLRMVNTISISDTQRYKQLGNAVTVSVVSAIVAKFPLVN